MRLLSCALLFVGGALVLSVPASAQYGYGYRDGYGGGGYGGGGYGGGGYGAARGSYRQTCTEVSQRGPILSATCRTRHGDYLRSSIDTRRCGGGVSNRNGRLSC